MEILDEVIEKLKSLEDDGERAFEEDIFPIRRLAEKEKSRQLKEGARIKVRPITFVCKYCTDVHNDPEAFFTHLVQKHICPGEEAREQIGEQEAEYEAGISQLEDLVNKHTEVMLDVNYTDEARDT
jgi:hypothetical protein